MIPTSLPATKVEAEGVSEDLMLRQKGLGSAVGQEISLDVVTIGLEQNRGAAQLANGLFGPLDHAMTLAGLGEQHLPGRRDLEALLGARLGLQLGHFALLFRPDKLGKTARSA